MQNFILPLQPNQAQKSVGNAYLKIRLDCQTLAVLPMEYAQEVVVIPSQRITPIPLMPACVLGLFNRHNKILWLVDLIQMLELNPLNTNSQSCNIVVIRVGQKTLGILVQEIQGLIRFSQDSIQSPIGNVSSNLTPYLRGCILQQREFFLVLDPEAIVNSSTLQNNQMF